MSRSLVSFFVAGFITGGVPSALTWFVHQGAFGFPTALSIGCFIGLGAGALLQWWVVRGKP